MALTVTIRTLLSEAECEATVARLEAAMVAPAREYAPALPGWTPCPLLTAPRERGVPPSPWLGGCGTMLAMPDADLPWAGRAWDALRAAAPVLGAVLDDADAGEDVAGLQRHIVGVRYAAGAWLPEHTDTSDGFRARAVGKVSATIRLCGPQTVSWGWMDVPALERGDMVAFASWRPHYVPPAPAPRYSAILTASGPPWR